MWCAFDGPPRIVRVTGAGEVRDVDDERCAGWFEPIAGQRAIIVVDVDRVADSCGYSVPLMEYVGERTKLVEWAEARSPAELDGLPGRQERGVDRRAPRAPGPAGRGDGRPCRPSDEPSTDAYDAVVDRRRAQRAGLRRLPRRRRPLGPRARAHGRRSAGRPAPSGSSPASRPSCRSTRTSSACCPSRSSTSSGSTCGCSGGASRRTRRPATSGILVDAGDADGTRRALGADAAAWDELYGLTATIAERVFPTFTEPLLGRDAFRRRVGDDEAWQDLFERPIGELLERRFGDDTVRGIVLDRRADRHVHPRPRRDLLANRCFLYHVVGRGTGHWDVPIGGMGTVSAAARRRRRRAGRRARHGRRGRSG